MRVTLILISTLVFAAATRAGEADVRPKLWTRGNAALIMKRFPASQVQYLTPTQEKRSLREQGYLMPRERDQLFRRLGLEARLAYMDALEKDALVMTAKTGTLKELKSFFPRLSERELRALKAAVRGGAP